MNESDPGARVGSVAQETARLLDALMGSVGEVMVGEAPSPGAMQDEPPCPTCGHASERGGDAPTRHTGSGLSGEGDVCQLCPVCQLLRVVRAVRPETLDRLADLAGAVTEALRDAAAARWQNSAGSPFSEARPSGPTVEDIPVADIEDSDEAEEVR